MKTKLIINGTSDSDRDEQLEVTYDKNSDKVNIKIGYYQIDIDRDSINDIFYTKKFISGEL